MQIMQINLEIGDVVYHKSYQWFGRVIHISANKCNDITFRVDMLCSLHNVDHLYDIYEGITWISTDLFFIKMDDYSEKRRLEFLIKYSTGY
jgi:hypothetical protein